MRLQVLCFEKNLVMPLRQSKSLNNKHLNCHFWTVTVHFWTFTVWHLLRFLSIYGVIELRLKRNLWCWKGKRWGYKFYVEKNPVLPLRQSKSLINKHLDCYYPTVTVYFWTVTVWPHLRVFKIYRVIGLWFKKHLWRWKGKTWGYKFYVLRRTQFSL